MHELATFALTKNKHDKSSSSSPPETQKTNCDGRLSFLLVFIALTLWLTSVYYYHCRRNLFYIWIYFLRSKEPFPIVGRSLRGPHKYVFSLRITGPNTDEKIKRLLAHLLSRQKLVITDQYPRNPSVASRRPGDKRRLTFDEGELTLLDISSNIWPLIRVAVDRVLYAPRHESAALQIGEINPESADALSIPRSPRNQIYFSYKMHIWQIVTYTLMIAIALVLSALVEVTASTQYPIVLGGIGILWGLFSIKLHRSQQAYLEKWADRWKEKPFGHSPIFLQLCDHHNAIVWEELQPIDFRASIAEFGVDNSRLLELVLAVLLIGFLSFLEVIR